MIELKNVSKSFENKKLFENLNMTIQDGDFVVFRGASGSGKTTLLNIIGSLEEADTGVVLVNGKDISKKKYQKEYLKNQAGFLFQNFALMDEKTVRQNLNIVKPGIRSEYTMEECLEYVGLSYKADTKVYKLSGGEQQRVALARLMFKNCSIILADEPTGSLDRENGKKVMELLKKMNQDGKTIIMVTHDEEYAGYGNINIVFSTGLSKKMLHLGEGYGKN